MMDRIKNRELKKYKDKGGYYYCFFLGTLPKVQGQGMCLMSDRQAPTQSFCVYFPCRDQPSAHLLTHLTRIGLGTNLLTHWLSKARSENLPVYLEATTARSHRLYLKLGFKDVEAVRIGKGKAAADGTYEKGGEGVPVWCMIWEPEGWGQTPKGEGKGQGEKGNANVRKEN